MSKKNICKFSELVSYDKLTVSQFVCETNKEVYSKEIFLRQNRAILVLSGSGNFYFSDLPFPYTSGNLVFGFKGEQMKCISQEDTKYMYIDFDGLRCNEIFRRFNITAVSRCFSNFEGVIPLWLESISRADENSIDLLCESMLLYAFSKIIVKKEIKSSIINQMFEITDNSFTDSELSLSFISQKLCYNPKYLSHLFKNTVGIGYNEYLRNLRIKFAITLFDSGLDSVKNVAALSGYSDAMYFSSTFKKVVGVSPTKYLKNIKQ